MCPLDAGGGAQFGRHQDAAGAVQLHVHGVAQEDSLPPLRGHRQRGDAFAKLFPFGAREHHQAAVRMLGDRELVGGRRGQDVTVPGRHGQPTLGIETQRRSALEHLCHPSLLGSSTRRGSEATFHHLIALFCTVAGNT
jgi:hypothetical protein